MVFLKIMTVLKNHNDDNDNDECGDPGSWFNLLTLLIVAWCALFVLPKLYLNNQVINRHDNRDQAANHDCHGHDYHHNYHPTIGGSHDHDFNHKRSRWMRR